MARADSTPSEAQQASERGRKLIEGLAERRERHQHRSKGYRIGFVLAGFVVVAAGIAMLVFPGPGWVAIIAGLGMLALEFDWAERLLQRVILGLDKLLRVAAALTPLQKAILAVVALLVAAVLTYYAVTYEVWQYVPGF